MEHLNDRDESFRDKISTVDEEGKRVWIYPKKPKGKFTNYRTLFAWILLAIFFITPFLTMNDMPLLMLNVPERHFVIFGAMFWPQDFHLFLIGTIALFIFIVLFTVIYGRLFCGWACPQTIFMEMIFRKIEYAIEGDRKQQIELDRAPWTFNKYFKKTLKHFIFIIVSVVFSNFFLMYIIGKEELLKIITDNPVNHVSGFVALIIFSGAFYGVFAFFREQVCTTVCPYGRLQGVLLDVNSINVSYDYVRGEKRAKFKKNEDRNAAQIGDCVDCGHCVHVCPTGIDIRNGVQLECINCTACIDACDDVMTKLQMPTGLIRYASEEGIAHSKPFKFTKRVIAYTIVLLIVVSSFGFLLSTRTDTETSILRMTGVLYQEFDSTHTSNVYNVKVINKTHKEMLLHFEPINFDANLQAFNGNVKVLPNEVTSGTMIIIFDNKKILKRKTKLEVGLYEGEKLIETISTTFIGPVE